eukprot:TRINITY_DN71197_c0_g1_i1.p1 TRINITY_DN71197_c0_g1~~TRINITY_DN71197_c0_g1_i1.p1  ORF type:complete len:369 (-),score=62.57 TRINITY_DN71197_c0_g1_i1:149-1153(-)
MCTKAVKQWSDIAPDKVIVSEVAGGVTNKLYKAKVDNHRVLIRVYGENTEEIINRDKEVLWMTQFQPLYARFNNGIVYTFIPGVALSDKEELLQDNDFLRKLAAFFATHHHLAVGGQAAEKSAAEKEGNFIIDTIAKWYPLACEVYKNSAKFNEKQQQQLKELNLPERKGEFDALVAQIKKACDGEAGSFCHNDTLLGNIIWQEETKKLSFIDFEYTCWNYALYDVGNNFDEWMGLEVDLKKFPSAELQTVFVEAYLQEANKLSGKEPPTAEQVERARKICLLMAIASHAVWGLWAFIQANNSSLDFDYVNYAQLRLGAMAHSQKEWADDLGKL